jgi:hypothetical protein
LIPSIDDFNRRDDALVHDLSHLGVSHIYSGYWTCNRLIFHTQERIICSAVEANLQPGLNRYEPYHTLVSADPQSVYVFPAADVDFTRAFTQKTVQSGQHYRQLNLDGFVVYLPT